MTDLPPTPAPADAWKTPEIREAESSLDRSLAKSRELLKKLDKAKIRPTDPSASDAEIASLEAAAKRSDAPAEMRLLARKVDAGELSWKDIAEGRAFNDADVRRMAMSKLDAAKKAYEDFEAGATLDEVIDARTGGENDPLAESPLSAAPPRPPHPTPEPQQPEPPAHQEEPPPPPARHRRAEVDEDVFSDPLSDSGDAPPPPSWGRPTPRRGSDPGQVDDDDYFGGNQWRG